MPEFDLSHCRSLIVDLAGEDPAGELSQKLLAAVALAIPAALVRTELAIDGLDDCVQGDEDWQAAGQRVKLMLIPKCRARREGLEEKDIEMRLREKAAEFGISEAILGAELEEGAGRSRLKDLLLGETTLRYLLDNF